MWNLIKEYRHYFLAGLIVIVPLFVLNASDREPAKLFWFDRVALRITAPVQKSISWSIDFVWNGFQNYLFLYDARQNNLELSEINRKLMNEIAAFREVALENERLYKLVKFSESIGGEPITARVIAQDILPEFRTIRLNKGSNAGISRGLAVVTHEGIVGRVIRVDTTYSDVLTLLDSSSNIAALVQRNRSRGVIEGYTESLLRLKHIRRTDDIRVGDVVISSGIGGVFPKGLVIGNVIQVQKKNYGITQTVEVFPSVDFSKLEEVMVLKNFPKTDIFNIGELAEPVKATSVSSNAPQSAATKPAMTATAKPNPSTATPAPAPKTPKPTETVVQQP
jgi:rod shape-determining protein MreC